MLPTLFAFYISTPGPPQRTISKCVPLFRSRSSNRCTGSRSAMSTARILSPSWLHSQVLSSYTDITILDARGRVTKPEGRVSSGMQRVEYISDDEAYFAGHIPGAAFIDWRQVDLARHMQLCDLFSQCGVERGKLICVYDWGDMLFATRVWYALKSIGCEKVGILNGGWKAWDEIGGTVSLQTLCPLKEYSDLESELKDDVIPRETVRLEEMRELVGEEIVLVDARSQRQFTGEERRARRGGHIPGAINVPYRSLLKEGSFGLKDDDELRQALECAGVLKGEGAREFVVYCNGGVSSTVVIFAMVRCGVPLQRIRNYCGSFNEWGNLDDTPLVEEAQSPNS